MAEDLDLIFVPIKFNGAFVAVEPGAALFGLVASKEILCITHLRATVVLDLATAHRQVSALKMPAASGLREGVPSRMAIRKS